MNSPTAYCKPARIVGRYAVFEPIGAGGMAAVHLGRFMGSAGFSRIVAVKRLHDTGGAEPGFVDMLIDEAKMSARVRHPNVVPTLDVVVEDGEVLLVMEYVAGESLYRLLSEVTSRGETVPIPIAIGIAVDMLRGLQAAHDATDEQGHPLHLVHRDVSPQNLLVGEDGLSRLLDFGVAKARGRMQSTRDGQLKGKLAYMSPEQLHGKVSPQSDVFAAAIVLWEVLTCRRMFDADNEGAVLNLLLNAPIVPPSKIRAEVAAELDAVVMRGLARDPVERFATAAEMADGLSAAAEMASKPEVAKWVRGLVADRLEQRASRVLLVETVPSEQLRTAPGSDDAPSSITNPVMLGMSPGDPVTPASSPTLTDGQGVVYEGPRGTHRIAFAVGGALLAVATLGLWWFAAGSRAGPDTGASTGGKPAGHGEADAGRPETRGAVTPPTPSASGSVQAPKPSSAPDRPVATVSPRPPVSQPSAATNSREPDAPPRSSAPAPTAPKIRKGCEQPSYIDKHGITRYKVECL